LRQIDPGRAAIFPPPARDRTKINPELQPVTVPAEVARFLLHPFPDGSARTDWGKTVSDYYEEPNGLETRGRETGAGYDVKGLFARDRLSAALSDLLRRGPGTAHYTYVHDVAMAGIAVVAALCVAPGLAVLGTGILAAFRDFVVFTGFAAFAYLAARPYRSLWCYTSLSDLVLIAWTATAVVVGYGIVDRAVGGLSHATWSTYFVAWLLMITLLSGPRVAARLYSARRIDGGPVTGYERIPLLLVGSGDGTELFIRALARDPGSRYRVVGIVDEMGTNLRRAIHGVEVLGSLNELSAIVARLELKGSRPRRLVVTEEQLSPVALQAMLDDAERLGLSLSRIPKVTQLRADFGHAVEIKPVAIEDLLGRPQTLLDRASMAEMCNGSRILVTGAGGTIGSELVRQICAFSPEEIILVDNSELLLYEIDLEVRQRFPDVRRSVIMADVRDATRIAAVFDAHRPRLVFHAAAMKHVPMVEMHPSEGILTNVNGTRNVADAARAFRAHAMVLISTDKAVNPTSVMGATKRVAECYCQALDLITAGDGGTRFLTVRFGNVLGSNGSVVPLFQKQLAQGGPLTVTHPDVTRYFMTTREAVALVLQASALGSRTVEHRGTIFTLEMGEPVRIQDLARQMIRLAGLRPGLDIDIVYTGLRPGEKLYEEPLHQSEELHPTELQGILLASPRTADFKMLERLIRELIDAAAHGSSDRAVAIVRTVVPEYTPTANVGGGLPPEQRAAPVAPVREIEAQEIA
jgi:FlaA1/EpsC-like NDP-sugar epimerase